MLSIKLAEMDFKARREEYGLYCVGRFIWDKLMNVKAYRSVMCQRMLMTCPFNFHIAHLPRDYLTVEVGYKIATSLSHCSKFEIKQDKEGNKLFLFRADVATLHPIRRVFVLDTPTNTEVVGLVQSWKSRHQLAMKRKLSGEASDASSKAAASAAPIKRQKGCPQAYASQKAPEPNAHHELHYVCLLLGFTEWHPNETVFPFLWYSIGRSAFPYLFILCSEGFSALLRVAEESGVIQGLDFEGGATISNLLFVDDPLLFADATPA
ncbi:hypothetical protein M9H77_01488 [Catharanthus roseus]|uniref:Uncharacterized protein n=1 Tax=Catharanthus roseus TaxID=4058 RepID=A0ACC0C647_CATRO|nr:hypothetical protein M9H77_01488 [Catharanthus roseus]